MTIATRLTGLLGGLGALACAHLAAAQTLEEQPAVPLVTEELQPGNAEPTISLTAASGTRYFRYSFVGNGYTWVAPPEFTPNPTNPRLGQTASVDPLQPRLSFKLNTSGFAVTGPAGSSTQYVDFAACTLSPNEFCNWTGARRIRFVVNPTLTATPSATIGVDGTHPREIHLETPNPTVNQPITGTCTVDTGTFTPPTIAIQGTNPLNSNAQGSASFQIRTTGLRLIAPSGTVPGGKCVFKVANGTNEVTVPVKGVLYTPTLSASPTLVQVPTSGTTSVDRAVTISTSPAVEGAIIDATCTNQSPAVVTIDGNGLSATRTTGADGKVTFQVNTAKLVTLPPVGGPNSRCRFKIRNFPDTSSVEYVASGRQITPSVSLNLTQVVKTGTTAVTATMSPAYPGFKLAASCEKQNFPATVQITATPTTTETDASGRQTFNIYADALVTIEPNAALHPSANCRFSNENYGNPVFLSFRTGNVCSFAMSPLPNGCGNPVE